jgi:hypothetical protein
MASATDVRRGLELRAQENEENSPSKRRLVQRAVAKARSRALEPFNQGERINGDEGSLTRLSEKIYLRTLVEEHNQGGKHLTLHQPVCLGYQYEDGVNYGTYSTPMLLMHQLRGVNACWPLQAGFDAFFGLSNKKFDLMGITTNSLLSRANPVCLSIVNQESAVAYEAMYTSMEGVTFELVHNLKLCSSSKKCEMCDSVQEQAEQAPVKDLLTPPKRKKRTAGQPPPRQHVYQLPLEHPMCDNTTKFSKFIAKKKPHLKHKIPQCAAHLTGISWQKEITYQVFQESSQLQEILQGFGARNPVF